MDMRAFDLIVCQRLVWDLNEAVRAASMFPRRVQEQENQKRQLCEELEQLKAPQDSREASCQTPASEEEVGDTVPGRRSASCRLCRRPPSSVLHLKAEAVNLSCCACGLKV